MTIYVTGMLHKEGHTVELEEIDDWNNVELWVNGEKIFECKIQELDYGKHRYDIYSSQSNTKLNAALMNTNVILVGLQNAPQNLFY